MCVICASPKGTRQPSISEIKRMFCRNPHGAGYMVAREGRVEIHKGFMNLGDFLAALKSEHFTAADSVVYHFRISTQAGVNPEMTHPFPLSNCLAVVRGGFYSHGDTSSLFIAVQRDDINALMPQKVNCMAAHIALYF